jgi:pimeloyl-ACP methyl ester carboxylesterase
MRAHTLLALASQGFRRVVYREWGHPRGQRTVICAHGLTRNGRDFDFLADALSSRYRVVCPDIAGRGDSDWLQKKEEYGFALYQSDATLLIARVSAPRRDVAAPWRKRVDDDMQIDWIGTSMGGLIGMMLAAQAGSPIRRLILNDVGPLVPWAALMRLKAFVGKAVNFKTLADAEAYIREVCATFGPLTDKQWRHLATHSVRGDRIGGYSLAYDPAISGATSGGSEFASLVGPEAMRGIDLWSVWDKVQCPTLVLRGAQSDLLLAETAEEMTRRGPKARVVEFENVGHAPALMSREQIGVIRNFLGEFD